MLRIEVKNQEITEANIQGSYDEVLTDLVGAVNTTINSILDEQVSKEEVFNELTSLLKKVLERN